jgi:hypothetical protein
MSLKVTKARAFSAAVVVAFFAANFANVNGPLAFLKSTEMV